MIIKINNNSNDLYCFMILNNLNNDYYNLFLFYTL